MGRVGIFDFFVWSFYVFDRKFDKGHSHLKNEILTVLRFDHSLQICMGFFL